MYVYYIIYIYIHTVYKLYYYTLKTYHRYLLRTYSSFFFFVKNDITIWKLISGSFFLGPCNTRTEFCLINKWLYCLRLARFFPLITPNIYVPYIKKVALLQYKEWEATHLQAGISKYGLFLMSCVQDWINRYSTYVSFQTVMFSPYNYRSIWLQFNHHCIQNTPL